MWRRRTGLQDALFFFLPGFARQKQSGGRKRRPTAPTFPSASLRLCVQKPFLAEEVGRSLQPEMLAKTPPEKHA